MAVDIDTMIERIVSKVPKGRANAISVRELAARVDPKPARSIVRVMLRVAQEAGFPVLTSPRAGVWIAAGDDERVEVVEELGEQIRALQNRQQLVNGGRCAWRECREPLDPKTIRRGGLYCRGTNHRFMAADHRARRNRA